MLPLSALTDFKVMIATPCQGGNTSALYSVSLMQLTAVAVREGLDLFLDTNSSSDVFGARNQMATKFLSMPEFTHLFFIDGDLGYMPESFFRLVMADKDVVSGPYPLKKYYFPDKLPRDLTREEFEHLYTAYPFTPLNGNESNGDGFVEVKETTTGFMCIKRHVLEKLTQAYPDWWYVDRKPDGEAGPVWDFFDPIRFGRRRLTEDYAFCKLCRDIGIPIFVDCNSKLDHLGQHIFRGDLAESLRAKSWPRLVMEVA